MVIGIAKTRHTMPELKDKMAEMYGKIPVQYTLYLPLGEQSESHEAPPGRCARACGLVSFYEAVKGEMQ